MVEILRGIWYYDTDSIMTSLGSLGFADIENFLVQIMDPKLIQYV